MSDDTPTPHFAVLDELEAWATEMKAAHPLCRVTVHRGDLSIQIDLLALNGRSGSVSADMDGEVRTATGHDDSVDHVHAYYAYRAETMNDTLSQLLHELRI